MTGIIKACWKPAGGPARAKSARRGKTPCQAYISKEEFCRKQASMEEQSIMTDNPVELDEHRGMAAQKLTEIRRRLHEVQADQATLRGRQEEFECHALAAPSTTWAEAAAEARYLLLLFAETSEARNPRRQELIAKVLDDLARLSD
jgi:hypothetical protein